MWNIKLTSKRQATFPVKVCDALKFSPGTRIRLEQGLVDGKVVYFIRPSEPDFSWIGCAKAKATGKSHRWSDIKKSTERGWEKESRP